MSRLSSGYHAMPPEMLMRSSLPPGSTATLLCMASLRMRTFSRICSRPG